MIVDYIHSHFKSTSVMTKPLFAAGVFALVFCIQETHAQSISNGTFNPMPGTFSGGGRTMSGVISGVNIGSASGAGGSLSGGFAYTTPGTVVSIDAPNRSDLPTETRLNGNYPNPFNPSTVIGYQLSVAGPVRLAVYDILGREVALLVNQERAVGRYEVSFNASGLSSGVYLYRLQLGGQVIATRRMTLVK
ncbi:MAG: hypothetical protein RL177_201 [Bacteroidota bacterium]|jgi:hypothetical protein